MLVHTASALLYTMGGYMARYSRKYQPSGFTRPQDRRCDDCEYRGALDVVGRPRAGRCYRCAGCGGKGRVEIPWRERVDPMYTGRT